MTAFITRDSEFLSKLGTLTPEQETVVDGLINAACRSIERYCRRTIAAADHDEVQPVGEDGIAFLDNYPVISVDWVFTNRIEALRLTNAAATSAAVTTTDEKLRLTSVSAGVKTTQKIDYADAPTLDDLASEIVGLGGGWSASVLSSYTSHPSSDLIRGQYRNCRTQAGLWLWLDADEDVAIDETRGIVTARAPEVRVLYRAGFTCIPDDLQRVAAEMVMAAYDKSLGTVQSESLGDYSVSYAVGAMNELPLRSKAVLGMYRDRRP